MSNSDAGTHRSREDRWEEHNRSFRYEAPDGPSTTWSEEELEELYDRVIGKLGGKWTCQKCTKPFSSLRKARSHVERHHSEQLIERVTDNE